MKLILLFLFFAFRLTSQSWVQLPDFPGTERDDGTVFVINHKAYCVTGLDVGFQCTKNGFIFDGSLETWLPMAPLPAGNERQYAISFSHGGYGYVLGGITCNTICLKDFWKYDPVADTWLALPDFPGTARQGMCNFTIKNTIYIAGGKLADGTILNDVWQYNPVSGIWTEKSNLPVNGLWRGSGFSIDTIGYIGYGMNNTQSYNHHFYAYDYLNDVWTKLNGITLPARRYVGTTVCNHGAGLYGGQDSIGNIANELMVFDPLDTTLTWKPGIPTFGRKGGMAFSLNNTFYLTTGVTNTARLKETWKASGFVDIEEINEINNLITYPNPATTVLNILISGLKKEEAVTEIYNALGQPVFSGVFSEKLDLSAFSNGIYIMFVRDKTRVVTSRFVKNG